jgi:putative Mg2+ transporter-C (MgtC) family protein
MICAVSKQGGTLCAPMLQRSRIQITFSTMGHEELVLVVRVFGSLLIGGLIGFERTFHGRPAGFRTHSLVCMASALLMLVTVYQSQWMTETPLDAIRTDPTRMAQGL